MEHLIEAVRKYPCLWNTTAIEYRDQELKDAAWAEVMKETDMPSVKEVKLKWKKLRDSYRDALKRQSEMLAKEPHNAAKRSYPWKYMGLMQFLQPYMSNRKKPTASPPPGAPVNNGVERPSSDESDSDAASSPKRRACDRLALIDRKLDYLCKANEKRERVRRESLPTPPQAPAAPPDPLDTFFSSMCQSTKRFPFPTQIKIKRSLFNAVLEAEEALLAEQQTYANLWAQRAPSASTSDADDEPPAS